MGYPQPLPSLHVPTHPLTFLTNESLPICHVPLCSPPRPSTGLRVATEKAPTNNDTATIGVFVDAGTRYEDESTNGVAHFLEHLSFKGTGRRSQRDLEIEFENMGGHLNAFTSREHTVYLARVLKKDIPQAMDLLGDILTNSELSDAAIERERGVIMRESEEVATNPEEVLFDYLHESAYQGTPLGFPILGSPTNIASRINRQMIQDYVDAHYVGSKMVVAAAGAVNHDEIADLAEKHFGHLPQHTPAQHKNLAHRVEANWTGSDVRVYDSDAPIAHCAVAMEGPGAASAHSPAFTLAQAILGPWDTKSSGSQHVASKLAQRVLEDPDGCESLAAFHTPYADTSLFGVYYTIRPGDIREVTHKVQTEMTRLCFEVTPQDLRRARNSVLTSLGNLDGTEAVVEDIGRQLLVYGRRIPYEEWHARFHDLSSGDVQDSVNKYIYDRCPVLAFMGPVHTAPDYNWSRGLTHWLSY
eukprot:TRINITY_DN1519_c0_g1_i1.p1 TRINITY_DN1519_c0_g1~~TRINITY_DN1519_c0_g1_i1.p1  ORF type:complete len:471 (-),score=128.28 TRINITY_DN1519_c0_g1_i1:271-1683(-)